jgi:GAF domain-containing protein
MGDRSSDRRDESWSSSERHTRRGSSPPGVQPVFDAILDRAVRLLEGYSGGLTRIVGNQITLPAITSTDPAGDVVQRAMYPQPLDSEHPHGQAIRSRVPINVADAQEDPRFP